MSNETRNAEPVCELNLTEGCWAGVKAVVYETNWTVELFENGERLGRVFVSWAACNRFSVTLNGIHVSQCDEELTMKVIERVRRTDPAKADRLAAKCKKSGRFEYQGNMAITLTDAQRQTLIDAARRIHPPYERAAKTHLYTCNECGYQTPHAHEIDADGMGCVRCGR